MRSGRGYLIAWILGAACILAAAFSFSARAEDLSRYCGHPVDSRHIKLIGKPDDPSRCTANCFRFTLTCNNGRTFSLASRYTPYDPDWFNAFTAVYPLPQLLFFGLIAFAVFVTLHGNAISIAANLTYLWLVGLAMYFWPAVATSPPYTMGGEFTALAGALSVFGLPVFLVLNIKALARGWNYLFVKHPVAPIVRPALRGKTAIDTMEVAKTLAAGAYDKGAHPAFHYENQAAKARALKAELEADAAAAEALRKRDEARAELAEAERQLQLAKQRGKKRR